VSVPDNEDLLTGFAHQMAAGVGKDEQMLSPIGPA
jgi:hypothetical protein